MTVAIVCGSRDYADAARVARVLDAAVERLGIDTIMEGEAAGADSLAREWALARGDISVIGVRADWDAEPKAAGPIRNALMARMLSHLPAGEKVCLAFPGNAGTANMKKIANAAGIRVIDC